MSLQVSRAHKTRTIDGTLQSTGRAASATTCCRHISERRFTGHPISTLMFTVRHKTCITKHTEEERTEKWCGLSYEVTMLDGCEVFEWEGGQFAHVGLHVLKVKMICRIYSFWICVVGGSFIQATSQATSTGRTTVMWWRTGRAWSYSLHVLTWSGARRFWRSQIVCCSKSNYLTCWSLYWVFAAWNWFFYNMAVKSETSRTSCLTQ